MCRSMVARRLETVGHLLGQLWLAGQGFNTQSTHLNPALVISSTPSVQLWQGWFRAFS